MLHCCALCPSGGSVRLLFCLFRVLCSWFTLHSEMTDLVHDIMARIPFIHDRNILWTRTTNNIHLYCKQIYGFIMHFLILTITNYDILIKRIKTNDFTKLDFLYD